MQPLIRPTWLREIQHVSAAWARRLQELDWLAFATRFRIDRMKPTDLEEVHAIERVTYPDPWPMYTFIFELLENPRAILRVIRPRDNPRTVCGYFTLRVYKKRAHLTNITLHPKYRGQGLGRYLLAYAMYLAWSQGAERMWLEVRVSNTRAMRLYTSFGFQKIRLLPRYYRNGEDAILMEADLIGLSL